MRISNGHGLTTIIILLPNSLCLEACFGLRLKTLGSGAIGDSCIVHGRIVSVIHTPYRPATSVRRRLISGLTISMLGGTVVSKKICVKDPFSGCIIRESNFSMRFYVKFHKKISIPIAQD